MPVKKHVTSHQLADVSDRLAGGRLGVGVLRAGNVGDGLCCRTTDQLDLALGAGQRLVILSPRFPGRTC